MEQLRIRLFATLSLHLGDEQLPGFPTHSAKSLFAYLVLHRDRLHPRERLMGTFWGRQSEKTAMKRLRTALWRVRSMVEPKERVEAGTYILVGNEGVGLNPRADYWLDVEAFETKLEQATRPADATLSETSCRRLREGIELYRGDLLEDVYEEWCLLEQERLRRLHVTALERLMLRAAGEGNWDEAISSGHRILRCDPLREHVHRDLMRLYYLRGNRPGALRQFARCRRALDEALDAEPMSRTVDLAQAIESEAPDLDHRARERMGVAGGDDATGAAPPRVARLSRLDDAVRGLQDTLSSVRQELDVLQDRFGQPPRSGETASREGDDSRA